MSVLTSFRNVSVIKSFCLSLGSLQPPGVSTMAGDTGSPGAVYVDRRKLSFIVH